MRTKYVSIHLNNGEPNLTTSNLADIELKIGDEIIIKFSKDGNFYEDNATIIDFTDTYKKDTASDIQDLEILRYITPHDKQIIENHKLHAKESMIKSIELVRKHNLDMKIIESKISHDNKVITLVFTAEERVDFRDLLKDLAREFKRQIRLRQIGPRDHAKILGGYGKCGRDQCCSSFLPELGGITMEMARVQDITSKGASKISGNCGKLLCCLSYELEVYKSLREKMPRLGQEVKTLEGKGTVVDLDVLKQMVKVSYIVEKKKTKNSKDSDSYGYKFIYSPVDEIKIIK